MKRLFVTIGIAIGLFLFALPGYASMTETNGGDPPLLLAGNFTESANDSGAGFAGSDLLLYIPSLISAIKSPAAINLTADPTQILADGTSTSNIQAVVTKPNGQHVEDGTEVAFSTNLGTISPNASPTNNGYAWATLTSATVDGTATVTARAGRISQTVPVELKKPVAGITLAASPLNIPADGTTYSIITATLTDGSGQPAPKGTEMTFETTSGTFLPSDQIQTYTVATADDSGMMVVFLRGTTADTATITVTSGGETSNEVYVAIFAAGPFAMTLQADPSSLPADGSSISAIRATVTDGGGSAVEDGTIVSFDVITGTGILSAPTAATTGGIATVTYTASITPGAETIRADTANGVFDTVNITLTGPTVGSVTVTPGSSTIIADGVSSTLIFAHVRDTGGGNIPNGTVVTFTTTAGGFSEVTTTVDGIATAKLTSSTNRGTATIRATAGGVTGTNSVTFIAGPPDQVIVTANPANLTADGTSTSTIGVTVLDANNNPVEDGSLLTLSAATGTLDHLTATTTDGVATVTYTAPNSVPAGNQDTITVWTTNGKTGAVLITLVGPQIATITLSANPTSLPADGTSTATISATLTVVGGGGPPDGTTVNFSITQGGGTITPTATTGGGVASATLTSGSTAETATIQAMAGGRTAQIDVDYTPGSVTLTIVSNALLGIAGETAAVTASLKDAAGQPAPDGELVEFSLSDDSLGSIPASALTSGGQGEAQVTFEANAKGGTVTVTGKWTTAGVDVTGSEEITIHPPPNSMNVAENYPDPPSISVRGTGGQSTSRIVFEVKDQAGNLVADGYRIDFVLLDGPNGGEEISPTFATTANGQVTTILRSGRKSGPVSIRATYHNDTNVNGYGEVTILAGPPVGEEMGISAQYINISGLQTMGLEDGVTITAGDIYGNAVPDNTAISFKTYNTGGLFVPGNSVTTGGAATNTLRSTDSPSPMQGFVSLTAEAINGGRTTHVTSIAVIPADPPTTTHDILYTGTDGGGVYKSTDSGVTWENVSRSSTVPGQNWIDPYVNDIAVDPDNPNTIYAATGYLGSGHVYRSLDGGSNWNSNDTEEVLGIATTDAAVLTVLCDDGSDYVWIGTSGAGAYLSSDGENFHVGGDVIPIAPTLETTPDIFDNPANTGDGTMTKPALSDTSQTEEWTLTYGVPEASATVPEAGGGNQGNGTMSNVTTDPSATLTENWAVTYGAIVGAVTPGGTNVGDGAVANIVPRHPNGTSETWTLACISITAPALFSVRSLAGGTIYAYPNATVDVAYDQNAIAFMIISGGTAFALNDTFTFTTTADWQVSGTVSGAQSNKADTGTLYQSDNNQVTFTIAAGGVPFAAGDLFTFSTEAGATPYWDVYGTVSGTQLRKAYNGISYRSDNSEISFTVSEGSTPFIDGDEFTFKVIESGLGHGKIVTDIVKAPGTHEDGAVLYAGTVSGVYRSTNGGRVWSETTTFTGDNITTLALHPSSTGGASDIIYAGTNDAGVWVSMDSGVKWTQYVGGLGRGLSASTPVADVNNIGTGVMSAVTVGEDAKSEFWLVECETAAPNPVVFSVYGTVSGDQPDYDISTGDYSIPGVLSFNIPPGTADFVEGDFFFFRTTRDPGREIKDLLVDEGNQRLYGVTYFWGPLEPHAVGNVYVVGLDSNQEPIEPWTEANTDLPQYDPPDDTTLFAQHALVSDVPPYDTGAATALYIGGEGINLYKASDPGELAAGAPNWHQSKSGLTNLIMSRMPVLFSGVCSMSITETDLGGGLYLYTVYIQDTNGNPPISGSTFTVTTHDVDGSLISTVLNVTYPDVYTYTGTFRDPSDPSTNIPYKVPISFAGFVAEAKFTFTPTCESTVPGCSGSDQEWSGFH